MTVTQEATGTRFELVRHDLYRDPHKGIREELFALTGAAGRLDPADRVGRADLARHVGGVVDFLVAHAEHEDTHGQAVIAAYLPALAARIESDHEQLEARMADLRALADANVDAVGAELRGRTHALYLDLASFTSDYLAHQDLEEREVMPAMDRVLELETIIGIHDAIVASIPPAEMAQALAVMLPAMNIDDRVELLGGMQAAAPPEVFTGVWQLAGSVLTPADHAALGARLGIAR